MMNVTRAMVYEGLSGVSPVAEFVLVLADPECSGDQCSPRNLCMKWHAAPSIELQQGFGGRSPRFF